MKRVLALTAALLTLPSTLAEPVEARAKNAPPATRPSTSSARSEEAVDAVVRRYGLAGEVLVAKGDRMLLDRGYGAIAPTGGAPHRAGERWRLASITKQVTATMIVHDFGTTLDRPIGPRLDSKRLPGFDQLTLRQLLTHHSGLPNPDDTPLNAAGVPAFYQSVDPSFGHCFSAPPRPGTAFAYNNCDYLVAASLLAFGAGGPLDRRWPVV